MRQQHVTKWEKLSALRDAIRPSAILAVALLAGGVFLAFSARGQQTQKPIQVQTNLVNLFVTVRDHHSAIVNNLKKEDFHIYEDNVEQKVAFFSNDVSMPITMGLLMDTSGSEQATLPAEQQAATAFMSEVMRKGDLSMVLSFDEDVDLLADFTEDKAVIDNAIMRTRINAPSGAIGPLGGSQNQTGTAFYDAVYLAAHDQLAGQAGRKAIVAATDAHDEGSKLKIQDAIEAAQRADAVIHILLVYDPRYGADPGAAQKMASETGGRMVEVRNEKSLQKAFDTISEELRQQYVLGYYPTNAARDGAFRKIRVEVTPSDMKTLTRKGYYAPKG
jgi:VWFA-related protein